MATGRRHFGSVRRLPSGRWQAGYWHQGLHNVAPATFVTKADALRVSRGRRDRCQAWGVDRPAERANVGL